MIRAWKYRLDEVTITPPSVLGSGHPIVYRQDLTTRSNMEYGHGTSAQHLPSMCGRPITHPSYTSSTARTHGLCIPCAGSAVLGGSLRLASEGSAGGGMRGAGRG